MVINKNYDNFYSKETYEVVGNLIHQVEKKINAKAFFGRIAGSKTQGLSSKGSDNDFLFFCSKAEGNCDTEIQGQVFLNTNIANEIVEFEIGYIYWEDALERINQRFNFEFENYPTNFYRSKEEEEKYLPENMPKSMRFREEYPLLMFHLALLGDSLWASEEYSDYDFKQLYSLEKTIDVLDTFYVRAYGNHVHFFDNQQDILLRKYLNVLSQIWAIEWLLQKGTRPPMNFLDLMDGQVLKEEQKNEILKLVNTNKQTTLYKTKAYTPSVPWLNNYIKECLERQREEIQNYNRSETYLDVIERTPIQQRQKIFCEKYREWRVI